MPDLTTTRADRAGLKTLVAFVSPEVSRQIKIAAATHSSTVQRIAETAILEWLQRYETSGQKSIATIAGIDKRLKANRNAVEAPARATVSK